MNKWMVMGMAILLIGCGEVAKVKQENVEPVGKIQGTVTSDGGGALEGVSVWILLNGVKVYAFNSSGIQGPTLADGIYYFEDVPLGSTYDVHFESAGYASTVETADLTTSPTDFPQGNMVVTVDTVLYKEDASLKASFEWFPPTAADWTIAPNVNVVVDLRDCGIDEVYQAKGGDDGTLTMDNLPGSYTGDFNGCRARLIAYKIDSEGNYYLATDQVKLFHGAVYDVGTLKLNKQ